MSHPEQISHTKRKLIEKNGFLHFYFQKKGVTVENSIIEYQSKTIDIIKEHFLKF